MFLLFVSAIFVMLTKCFCQIDLYILGLFPFEGAWPGGVALLNAVQIGLEQINEREDVLPGYKLNLIWNNSKCNPGLGVDIMYKHLYAPPTKILILGDGCSGVSEATGQSSHLWNLVQMSYVSVSPSLSDKNRFPRFVRSNSPDVDVNPARVEIFKQFGWSNIATLHQSFELFSVPTEDLMARLKEANMTIVRSEIITGSPAVQVKALQDADVRIIVGSFYENMARQVFCEAYKVGLYGNKIVWVINGWFDDFWWLVPDVNVDCTPEEMSRAVEGYIAVDRLYISPIEIPAISGLTPSQYLAVYANRTNNVNYPGTKAAPMGYDSIWALALALNDTLTELIDTGNPKRLEDFAYSDAELGLLIWTKMLNVKYRGVRGQVAFNEKGDPVAMFSIDRIQGGEVQMVGLYDPNLVADVKIEWLPATPIVWAGGKIPKDSLTIYRTTTRLSFPLYLSMCCISALGIALSICFLAFNIHFRKLRIVKMSSPRLNNVILAGCVLLYITVFLEQTDKELVAGLCLSKVYLLTLGFSMAFGALFAKTWRVHVIFTNATKQKKVLKDSQLFVMVGVLVAINTVVLLSWTFIDPLRVIDNDLDPVVYEDRDVEIRSHVETCTSTKQIYFVGTLFGIQGILLLLGTFLAWETRKVKLDGLNDSKMIGLCIYNVIVLSFLGVTVSMTLGSQIELNYALTSIIVIIATTVTMCLIVVPKIVAVRTNSVDIVETTTATNGAAVNTMQSNVHTAKINILELQLKEKDKEIARLKEKLDKAVGGVVPKEEDV
ncbi:gamma-aminobutyric acid type B receptor subunit 1-like [Haliotis rufescens]|uniref:gamma-aminobutyric acid type B receptor subunit 1-like n=1 Tax=Haliotis rufescens TaxID=6454 RepID=UPI00201EA52D|nr:gamma-aminobutyric acid type B receptor subunit 1-like [Haliotis rufescens]